MLYPKTFLKKLLTSHITTKYARITKLTWQEEPIETIEGRISAGSINIDGNSAIRTTTSLTLQSTNVDLSNFNIALKSKVKIEIGLKNDIDKSYPDIIWLSCGIFIVNSFNTSLATNQTSISISTKDKGCLLNGEISGSIPVSTDFGQIDEYANSYEPIYNFTYTPGKYYYKVEDTFLIDYSPVSRENVLYYEQVSSITTTKLPIKEIIKNMVHVYGHEPLHKIIINDLDIEGSELLEYRGDKPLYLIKEKDSNTNTFVGITFDKDFYIGEDLIGYLEDEQYLSLSDIDSVVNKNAFVFGDGTKSYYVIRIEYGDTMGYKNTELTYPGELIAGVGETVVSILDKVKNVLGNFEYFYDVEGNFVFQAKHSYENVDFSKISTDGDNEVMIDGSFYNSRTIWDFNDEELNTQISHTPNITNLRNDFSIWGEREGANGAKLPVHLRYAIQEKPYKYTTIGNGERSGITYTTGEDEDQLLQEGLKALLTKDEDLAALEEKFNEKITEYQLTANELQSDIFSGLSTLTQQLKINVSNEVRAAVFGKRGN